jgi:ABC-type branched-subunit amino acid transport system ATPase component
VSVPALETRGLCKNFGALEVARQIDIALMPGARHALIGPNGAGKTTLINLITGVLSPTAGHVFVGGTDITGLSQAARVKRGIARTFQINTLFRGLTVLENVCMAIAEREGVSRRLARPLGRQRRVVEEALALLESLRMADDAARLVRELPYGRQRLVEIAIALGLRPKVLLLDEPAAGVPTAEAHILLEVVEGLPSDIAMLIIEHDMDVVFRFAHEITVLVSGGVFARGAPQAIAADERVREVYLGHGRHD